MAPDFDTAAEYQSVQACVTSCMQMKIRGKRGKRSSRSFSSLLVFGWIGFAGSKTIWAGSLLLGLNGPLAWFLRTFFLFLCLEGPRYGLDPGDGVLGPVLRRPIS
jgi:hypothetical protein